MTNTELTLDQLTAIAGGVQMGPDGSTCTAVKSGKNFRTSSARASAKAFFILSSASAAVLITGGDDI